MRGMAPDGGLYVPESIPGLDPGSFEPSPELSLHSIGAGVLSPFIDCLSEQALKSIIGNAWNFPIPLIKLEDRIYLLELFHGPTLAFKDVGARFMAHVMSHLLEQQHQQLTIIVATSGDTGSAVAHGFFHLANIDVFVLYPSGMISRLQEQQMTTLGGNITAVEVEGTFDDCQRLVKSALNDSELQNKRALTTANSINVGRLLPQIAYYVWGLIQMKEKFREASPPLMVVPSGNFGNLTAAVYAKRMGAPIRSFVAATNANDVVVEYLRTGSFSPRPGIQTYSNAMDVGNPSNLARLQTFFKHDVSEFRRWVDAVSITDEETLNEIRCTYEQTNYVLDPHTAVAVAATRKITKGTSEVPVMVAATAHPAKFPEVVKETTGLEVPLPDRLQEAANKPKHSIKIREYREWRELLITTTT